MWQQAQLEDLIFRLTSVYNRMLKLERRLGGYIQNAHPNNCESAENLIDYLALRNLDLRNVQEQLMMLGLSSLGRTEAHTKASLCAVIQVLHRLAGHDNQPLSKEPNFQSGKTALAVHTKSLLGAKPTRRNTRIMVTLPDEAQEDYSLVREMLTAGMNCARINCAHNDEQTWAKMVANLRKAADETGCSCQILMDLGGPKPRIVPINQPILLFQGDTLQLQGNCTPAQSVHDETGKLVQPASIACTLPQVFQDLQVGESVMIDDGKIAGILRSVSKEKVCIEILQAKTKGSKLWGDEGLNFPNSKLSLSGITAQDLMSLDFVVAHADLVGLSFVNEPKDVLTLLDELQKRKSEQIGIVLKIETQRGFKQLPLLLLTAMRNYPIGVMIARGDLAIEMGWERMSEVQEEILWLCEAAHVPVVWATQVLENLVKKGNPSRAEITDAAMAQRAECVMLNKGPHILEAVRTLDNILERMQGHQNKKTSTLRRLHVCDLEPTT
jgi:pyruvate kinase